MRSINKQSSDLAFAKSLPICAVWFCVYASASVITDCFLLSFGVQQREVYLALSPLFLLAATVNRAMATRSRIKAKIAE